MKTPNLVSSEPGAGQTDCAHNELAVWQYSVNSMAHPRGNKRQHQCCSAGDWGSKQPEKCTQEFLALDHRSINSTPKSGNGNRCHCSVQLADQRTLSSLVSKRLVERT